MAAVAERPVRQRLAGRLAAGIRSVNAGMSNVRRVPNPPAESLKVASAGNTARQDTAPKKTANAECLMGWRSDGRWAPETTTPRTY